jgi:hypothetical protein
VIFGVLADTHIPDRRRGLHPEILPLFRRRAVDQILHAGDVSVPSVLRELATVAPVRAVRGNRDWVRLRHLSPDLSLTVEGVQITLAHGHGSFWRYWLEKVHLILRGYRLSFYATYLLKRFPEADVIIFGHSHIPEIEWFGNRLLLNPGSSCCPHEDFGPTVAVLDVDAGRAEAEIVRLGEKQEEIGD